MPLLRQLAYAGKSVPIGHAGFKAAKFLAGIAFDLFKGDYRIEGMVFHIPREHTPITVRGRFMVGTYEEAERQLAIRHLPPDATVLELGGCIGVLSCTINRLLTAPRRHVVLEAHPALPVVLKRNRDANGCSFAVRHAVLSRRDDVRFSSVNLTDGRVVASGGIPVPTVTLEELEQDTRFSFDALVMDIEGGEAEVIDENPALFDRVKFLLVEFTPAAIGAHGISRLREKLLAHGLNHIDTMMATEVWVR
jgi:FkbM family methyltransferase